MFERGGTCVPWFIAVLACGSCAPNTTPSVQPQETAKPFAADPLQEPLSELDRTDAEQRRAEVEAEIEQLGSRHAWAGIYRSFQVGECIELAVAPNAGFAATSYSYFGRSILTCGHVSFADSALHLEAELLDFTSWDGSTISELFFVRWGKRDYLLSERELIDLCNDINSGMLAASRVGGWRRAGGGDESGTPEVPPVFRAYVLDEPITATILSVSDWRENVGSGKERTVRRIVCDVGARNGAFVGMAFFTPRRGAFFLPVSALGRSTCVADCRWEQQFDFLTVGAKLSTRHPQH